MSISIVKEPMWNLSMSAYDEINDLPLMENPGPVLIILASYLLFVLKLGPAFMMKREPLNLKTTMAIYNVFQVLLSMHLVQMIFLSIWWYFAAKVTELLDTVFFVLRKKDNQVTFLHLYHHSIMMFGTWATLKYSPTQTLLFVGLANSIVHVVMYTYYGLAGFGPRFQKYLKWKKYITTLQLIQFISIVIMFLLTVKYCPCPPPKGFSAFIACNTMFFFYLFFDFYRKSYNNKSMAKPEETTHLNGTSKKIE